MKKLLLSALLAAGAMLSASAEQILIGDSQRDQSIWVADGLCYDSEANLGIALRIPARTLQAYPGAKIIGLRIAAADQCKNQPITAFLAKGAMNQGQLALSEYLVKEQEHISWTPLPGGGQGEWDNTLFSEPYTIPEAKDVKFDLYFGIYTHAQANQRIVGLSSLTQQVGKNKVYLAISEPDGDAEPGNWEDITNIPGIYSNNVCICAILELPEETETNAMSMTAAYAPSFGILDSTVNCYVYLSNDGPTTIKNFEVTTIFEDNESVQTYNFPEDEPMPVGYVAENRQAMPLPIPVLGSGVHTMTITKVNGEENLADPESTKHEFNIIGIPQEEADKYRRRPVLEYFCAENDHQSGVYQDAIVLPGLEPYKGWCTFLPQHSDDKFGQNPQDIPAYINGEQTTITLTDGDRLFIGLVGDINQVMIPSQTIDRSMQMDYIVIAGKNESTVTATLYPEATIYSMNEALRIPTFASVELTNTYNEAIRALTVQAAGTVADVLPAGEKASLALYLIEEGVKSDSQEFPESDKIAQMYPDGTFTHARVVRQMITPFEGEELEPGEYLKTYTVDIENPRWNPDHMKVIALIQRPLTNGKLDRNIINSAEKEITSDYEEFEFSSIENIEAAQGPAAIYDLQGRRLNAPTRGINIINGKKILVK